VGRPWWYDSYWEKQEKLSKRGSIIRGRVSRKLVLVLIGFAGTFLLYVSLLPVVLNGRNQSLFAGWWNCIWVVGGFSDYLRAIFVIIMGLIFARGFLGVILSLLRPTSATKYIFYGGVAGLVLLTVFWSGILNGSGSMRLACAFLSGWGEELNKAVVWGATPPGLNFLIVRHILSWGWLKLALAGCGIWVVGTVPFTNWWRRLT